MGSKSEFPEPGDLVVATVSQITPYGAYVTLDEYGKEGLLHISEVSSSWVRNIRDHVREGQKVVLKVLRVDAEKGHVDLSLRRVTGREKKEKLFEWKRSRKAEALLKMAAEKLGVSFNELYQTAGVKLEEHYGGLYEGLEDASERGVVALVKLGIPENYATVLAEIAKAKIQIPRVKVKGLLELTCPQPRGVEVIREALISAKNLKKPREATVEMYVVGAPRYRVEVSARNYKDAEKLLQGVVETAINVVKAGGGHGTFKRLEA
jgi:translation initiation factor 2 subunit 1